MKIIQLPSMPSWPASFPSSKSVVTTVALAALVCSAYLYRRLNSSDVLPIDRTLDILGLSKSPSLTDEEAQVITKLTEKYAPDELLRRCIAYASEHPDWNKVPDNAADIVPSFQDGSRLSIEDEKAAWIQSWAMYLQPLFALVQDNMVSWKNLLSPIQSSPRLASTILFNAFAPYAAQSIWEGIYDYLPSYLQDAGDLYIDNKGKIAIGSFLLLLWLYRSMNQEKGILTDVTDNYDKANKPHRALDTLPSYQNPLGQVLQTLGISNPGNILWHYNEEAHSTFTGKIDEILGEMTATGRVQAHKELMNQFPHLKDLKVFKFNISHFLTEYGTREEVLRGWNDTLNHLSREKNCVVVLTDLDKIMKHLLPPMPRQNDDDRHFGSYDSGRSDISPGELLADRIILAMKENRIKCIMEVTEQEKDRLTSSQKYNNLFVSIQSPNISPQELQSHCKKLYTDTRLATSFSKEEVEELFAHMMPSLTKSPRSPDSITSVIENNLTIKSRSWRTNTTSDQFKKIELAEKNLRQAQTIRDLLLHKRWKNRRQQQEENKRLSDALACVEYRLIPLYAKVVKEAKQNAENSPSLITAMQHKHERYYGAATQEEIGKLQQLESHLNSTIKGQTDAVKIISEAVLKWRTIPPMHGKPLVLFFAGPSGVGKSQTATKLAAELNKAAGIFDSTDESNEPNVKRINLNRQKQGGFFGWEKVKADIFFQILRCPTTTLIFEEWDKMSPEDMSSLLEILDDSPIHIQHPWSFGDGKGSYVDKSCLTVIFTSNVKPGEDKAARIETIKQGIKAKFVDKPEETSAAFLNRIDAIVPFNSLEEAASTDLLDRYLDHFCEKLPVQDREKIKKQIQDQHITDARVLEDKIRTAIYEINSKSVE